MKQSIESIQQAKRSLLIYSAVLIGLCASLQGLIAYRGNNIDVVSQLFLAVIALYYAWYNYVSRDQLRRVRFGRVISHMIVFLVVNVSYHLHALILFTSNSSAITGTKDFGINEDWFGLLFGMTTFWGLGLLVHTIASVANRGFEELPRG